MRKRSAVLNQKLLYQEQHEFVLAIDRSKNEKSGLLPLFILHSLENRQQSCSISIETGIGFSRNGFEFEIVGIAYLLKVLLRMIAQKRVNRRKINVYRSDLFDITATSKYFISQARFA